MSDHLFDRIVEVHRLQALLDEANLKVATLEASIQTWCPKGLQEVRSKNHAATCSRGLDDR